jgi:hypothetical protein
MFILNEDGIVLSLDFTKISKKWQSRTWIYYLFFYDFNSTVTIIMCANFLSILIYLKFFRNRSLANTTGSNSSEDPLRNTNAEIVQLLQEIIRLNNIQNAIGGSITNLNNIANNSVNNSPNNINAENVPLPNDQINPNTINNADVNLSSNTEHNQINNGSTNASINASIDPSNPLDPGSINTETNPNM